MIALDTNVLSELLRVAPAPAVEVWLAAQNSVDIYLTAISEAELRYGVAIMADGKRRKMLAEAVDGILREDFHSRILPFDSTAAGEYTRIGAERRTAGRPISAFDSQITAIAVRPWQLAMSRISRDAGSR